MGLEYCNECDRMIDLDYNIDHEHFRDRYKEVIKRENEM